MPMIPFHPAPGLGELMPGQFAVPQNPLLIRAGVGMVRQPRLAELMPGAFNVPQNPLITELSGNGYLARHNGAPSSLQALKAGGCGCGCGGDCGLSGGSGMGFLGLETMSTTTMLLLGAGVLLLFMAATPGGSEYRQRKAELRARQSEQRRQLRSEYRGYKRAGRAVKEKAQETAGSFAEGGGRRRRRAVAA